jgi:hypothetical protein
MKAGLPDCLVSLPALSVYQLSVVPATSTAFKSVFFVLAVSITNNSNKIGITHH